jgi:hypothetical protein
VLDLECTRRGFIGSTSLVAAAAALPTALYWSNSGSAKILVSAERAPLFSLGSDSVLLDGPRIARLQMMTTTLPKIAGDVVLRLDATDESLLDVAAQQAGVSVKLGAALPDGFGIRAHVTPIQRNFA